MIGKVISVEREGIVNLIVYALQKDNAEELGTNLLSDNAHEMATEMLETLNSYKNKAENPFKHFILSYAPTDKVNINMSNLIVEDYLHTMGYSNNQFLAVMHHDTNNVHMHIVVNRMDVVSEKIVKDSQEKVKSRNVIQNLEKKYNLYRTASIGESKHEEFNPKLQKHEQRVSTKSDEFKYILDNLKKALKKHPISFDKLEEELKSKDISIIISRNKKGLSYQYNSSEYKSSELGRNYSLKNLNKTFISNAHFQFNKALKECLNLKPKTIEQCFELLRVQGFNPSFNNAKNGWNMEKDGVIFKGSELNRMGLKNLIVRIEEIQKKELQKAIRNIVYSYLGDKGDEINGLTSLLENSSIRLNVVDNKYVFKNDIVTISEKEFSGQLGSKGLKYHLVKNKLDNIIDNIGRCNNFEDYSKYLSKHLIGIDKLNDNSLIYSIDNLTLEGDSLRNNDNKVYVKLDRNNIQNIVNEALKKSPNFDDFTYLLSQNNIITKVNESANSIEYFQNNSLINKGNISNLIFVNNALNNNAISNVSNQMRTPGFKNLTAQNREDEGEEEDRRRKYNNNNEQER